MDEYQAGGSESAGGEALTDDPGEMGAAVVVRADGYSCITCGYSLDGLLTDGACPECGTPIADSMRGNLLRFRSEAYLRSLKLGLSLVLNGILLQVFVGLFVGLGLGIAGGFGVMSGAWVNVLSAGVQVGTSAMILFGWWKFTTRDPGDPTPDGQATARKVVRVAVSVSGVVSVLGFFLQGVMSFSTSPDLLVVLGLIGLISGIASLAAFVTQFFAGMLYVRGMALRLPNEKIHRLAKTRMIACPIWATVGIILLFLGPLIALVLYWNLLNMFQKDLKVIVKERASLQAS